MLWSRLSSSVASEGKAKVQQDSIAVTSYWSPSLSHLPPLAPSHSPMGLLASASGLELFSALPAALEVHTVTCLFLVFQILPEPLLCTAPGKFTLACVNSLQQRTPPWFTVCLPSRGKPPLPSGTSDPRAKFYGSPGRCSDLSAQ